VRQKTNNGLATRNCLLGFLFALCHYATSLHLCVNRITRDVFQMVIPQWLFILAAALAFPFAFAFNVLYKLYTDERDTAAHGTVLPPQVLDKYIGGLGTLSRILAQVQKGYTGKDCIQFSRESVFEYTAQGSS
jgi:hypothetical protein